REGTMESIFWGALFLAFYSYLVYPTTLLVLRPFLRKSVVRSSDFCPPVTLIITVHNEQRRIREKLENTRQLDYPQDLFQILVASDGSSDDTNTIVEEYEKHGIQLLPLKNRAGKENAQREAVKQSTGHIIVFSDVATQLDRMAIRNIVANFADQSIGCVSSVDKVMESNGTGGEGAYVRYEMWLRNLECSVYSVVGLSGSFFAARKQVCQDFSTNMPSDFRTLLNSIKLGFRGISDPLTAGYYHSIKNESKEFDRKIRTVLRGITTFFNHTEFLNIFRFGLFTYQYVSHKLMRWFTPFFLILSFGSHTVLAMHNSAYKALFLLHVGAYFCALLGFVFPSLSKQSIIRIPKYFVIVNGSILVAWFKYFTGHRQVVWNPSVR
ncbi:MAG: glycosyltransferase family 2 protein, partial [Chitinispirillaceae bacterium]